MDMEQDGTPFPTRLFRSDAFRRKVRVLLDCCSDDPSKACAALAEANRMLAVRRLKDGGGKSSPVAIASAAHVRSPKHSAEYVIPIVRNSGRRKGEATAEGFA